MLSSRFRNNLANNCEQIQNIPLQDQEQTSNTTQSLSNYQYLLSFFLFSYDKVSKPLLLIIYFNYSIAMTLKLLFYFEVPRKFIFASTF